MKVPKLDEFTKNEINILESIDNPNIIKFVEILRSENNAYFVYEYCNQGTLESRLFEKKNFSEKEAIIIFK